MSELITCRELVDFLADYLASELDDEERASVNAHLAACPSCVLYLKSYQEAVRLSRAAFAPDEAAPADVPEDLIRAVLDARKKPE
jgi:anti-sigma factor RsiW